MTNSMMNRSLRWGICVLLGALSLVPLVAGARVFHSRESALKLAFPGAATVEPTVLYLTPEELARCSELARVTCEERVVRAYVGKDERGAVLGHAFIDTHKVRTMPETLLFVVSPQGSVSSTAVLAFHEPEEYLAPPAFLAKLTHRKLDDELRLGGAIDAMSGATITSNAVAGAARRVLALHRLKLLGAR